MSVISEDTRSERTPDSVAGGPTGVGGWLLLIAIGLIVAPILNAKNLWDLLGVVRTLDWSHVASVNPLGVVTLVLELLLQSFMVVASVALLYLFSLKKRRFPKLAIVYMWILVLLSSVLSGFAALMVNAGAPGVTTAAAAQELAQTIKLLLIAVIWTPYLLRSRRVKNTFVQ